MKYFHILLLSCYLSGGLHAKLDGPNIVLVMVDDQGWGQVAYNGHPHLKTRRVFLKDPSFHNTLIQFDFKLSGKATDLRLVTGSGGSYNSVTQIHTGPVL